MSSSGLTPPGAGTTSSRKERSDEDMMVRIVGGDPLDRRFFHSWRFPIYLRLIWISYITKCSKTKVREYVIEYSFESPGAHTR